MSAAVKDKVTKQVEDRLATLNEGIEVEERTFRERIADKVAERDELAALLKRVKGPESRKPGSRKSGNRQTEFVKIVKANPGISATIRDRFYGAASSTPVAVFSHLMKLKNHHISKLENRGRAVNMERLIGEIMADINDFPAHLPLPDQGRFAVGYYHQRQDFFTK